MVWVRSQDASLLLFANQFVIVETWIVSEAEYRICCNDISLGRYKTEKVAKKTLSEIEDFINEGMKHTFKIPVDEG